MTTLEALYEAFALSDYLHSVGSGDEQAMELVAETARMEFDSDEEAVAFLAGGLAARALTTDLGVMNLAQQLWDTWVEEYENA